MIEQFYDLHPEVLALDRKALDLCRAQFAHVEEIRDYNQLKMLRAFTDCGVEARHFWGSSGYGVWDDSRNKLEEVFARCMGAEAALVRPQFMSGTHTLTVALFGLLRTGDTLLAATGRPYDTLEGVIGIGDAGKGCGTLREFGVNYDECPLLPDFTPDYDLIAEKARTATVVHIQRSRGYTQRNAFDLATIQKVADTARKANPNAVIFVDNCYGEFTQTAEPVAFGADIMAGSFIKNPGGGITPTGGYIAGRKDLVEKCSHRFTAPGIGGDLGCTQDSLRDTFLGFYYAPGVVCEALKTAIYAQCLLELAGVNPVPRYTADHNDIVTCFDSGSAAALTGFCAGIQHNSPVDSFASPEPADEPGYTDKVVMASGSFTEGSTIEISCDGPLRAPYTCYLQGGVNFTAGRAAVLNAVQNAFFRGVRTNSTLEVKKPPAYPNRYAGDLLHSTVLVLHKITDQRLQQVVAVNAADDGAGILVGRDVGRVLRQDVADELIDGVVALLLQRTVHLQHRLLDLHITVITDGKNGGRFRDRHFNSPLHYDITSLIILNMRQICKMKTQNFYTEMQITPLCFLPAAVL